MKELSIEQKARAYDEAIERANSLLNGNQLGNAWIYKLLPELKEESEDERIRKEIISALKFANIKGVYDKHIAWLEKAGNNINCIYDKELSELLHIVICRFINDPNKPYSDREKVSMKVLPYVELLEKQGKGIDYANKEYWRGYREGKQEILDKYTELEKQAEQKSVNDLTPQEAMDIAVAKCFEQGEQKPAWSEEAQEEQVSEEFINALDTMLNDGLPDRYLVSEERIKKSAELLFSIARKQLKIEMQEWNKEDENNISFLTSIIEECFKDKEKITLYSDTVCAHFTKEDVIDRLNSLRPKTTWKPSDKQMNLLKELVEDNNQRHFYTILRSLYEQLKKLREELI